MNGNVLPVIYIMIICGSGGFVTGTTSFGYAMLCMPLLSLFLEIKTATIIMLVSSIVMFVIILRDMKKSTVIKLPIKNICFPFIGAIAGGIAGVALLKYLRNDLLVIILGVSLMCIAVYMLFLADKIKLKATVPIGLGAGTIAEIMGGTFNIMGPPMVSYFHSVTNDQCQYNTYLQSTLMLNTLYLIVVHAIGGNISVQSLLLSVPAIVAVGAGTLAGIHFFKKMNRNSLKIYLSLFVFVSGIVVLIKNL